MRKVLSLVLAVALTTPSWAQGVAKKENHPVLNPQYMSGFMQQEKKNFQQIFEDNKDNWAEFAGQEPRELYNGEGVTAFFKEVASDPVKLAELKALDAEVSALLAEHNKYFNEFKESYSDEGALRATRNKMYREHSPYFQERAERIKEGTVLWGFTAIVQIGAIVAGCYPLNWMVGVAGGAAIGGNIYDQHYLRSVEEDGTKGELNALNRTNRDLIDKTYDFWQAPACILDQQEPVLPYNLYEIAVYAGRDGQEFYNDFSYVVKSLDKYPFPEWELYKNRRQGGYYSALDFMFVFAEAYRKMDREAEERAALEAEEKKEAERKAERRKEEILDRLIFLR